MKLKILVLNCLVPFYALKHKQKEGIEVNKNGDFVSNHEFRIQQFLQLVEEQKPEVALLQEFYPELEKEILKHYPKARIYSAYKDERNICVSSIVIFADYIVGNNSKVTLPNSSTAVITTLELEKSELTLSSLHLKGSAEDSSEYIQGVEDLDRLIKFLRFFSQRQIIAGDFNKNLLSKRSVRRKKMEEDGFSISTFCNYYGETEKVLSSVFSKGNFIELEVSLGLNKYEISDHIPVIYEFNV